MKNLRNGKWNHQMASFEEIYAAVSELKNKMIKYGWQDKRIFPYGRPIKLSVFLDTFKELELFTTSSVHLKISELNGVIDIANTWEKLEHEPKVKVKLLCNGKEIVIPKSIADDYIEMEMATLI